MPLAQPVSEDISGHFFISQESSPCHTRSIVTTEDRILKLLSGPHYTPLDVHGLAEEDEHEMRKTVAAYCLAQVGKPYNLNFLNAETEGPLAMD